MNDDPVGRAAAAVAGALLLAAAAACGGDGSGDAPPRRDARPPRSNASLPSARYLTVVAWTAPGGRPAGVLWLENRTGSSGGLDRRYRGWSVDGDRIRRVLSVDDRLPVRSAAWRPLPAAAALGLSVDTKGRISALRLGGDSLRLELGRELASWRGARGQRQRLASGRLRAAGDTSATGVTAALLRFRHLAGEPGPPGPARLLLLADAAEGGGGLLVVDEGGVRPWSRGWRWVDRGDVSRLREGALPDSARSGGPWRIAVPGGAGGQSLEWSVAVDSAPPRPGTDAELVLVPASAAAGPAGEPRARGFLLRRGGAEEGRTGGRGDPGGRPDRR